MVQRTGPDAVVVGCDGSWQSQAAVVAAAREARRRGQTLVVFAVAKPDPVTDGLSEMRRSEGIAWERARAVSKRAARLARDTDPEVSVEVVVTGSLDTPAAAALAERAGLVVLGGHGAGGQRALSIGSTSNAVAHWALSPVLVPATDSAGPAYRPGEDEREPVVIVGVLGAGDSDLLRYAAVEARLRGASLVVLHAVVRGSSEARLAEQLEALWQLVHAEPACGDIPCRVEVVEDHAAAALLARSRPGDLVVVGTRGGGTLAGLIEGSVAREVLDAGTCDVIVVPPGVLVREVDASSETVSAQSLR